MNKGFVKFSKKAEANLKELAAQVKAGTFTLEEAGQMQAGFVMKNHPHGVNDPNECFRVQRNQIALEAGIGLRPEWM